MKMVRNLMLCWLLFACGCNELEEAGRPTREQRRTVRHTTKKNSPNKTETPKSPPLPEKLLSDGPVAALRAHAEEQFSNSHVLLGLNKESQRREFQPIEKIEVDIKTSETNPQHIQGVVRLYATQKFLERKPDIYHEFRLDYEYSPLGWTRGQTFEHSWSVSRAGLSNPAEQDWDYDVDFEIKRMPKTP